MSNQNYSLSSNNPNPTKYNIDQSSSKTSTNDGFLNKSDSKKDSKSEEFKSNNTPKADFLDKTDPNETGRNVAQLIFDQENEDKKTTSKNIQPDSASSTTTSNPKKKQ